MEFDKRMSRVFVFLILGMFVLNLMGGVLGAEVIGGGDITPEKAAEGVKALWGGGATFFTALFKDTALGSDTLSRIFMTVLIAMFVFTALGSFFADGSPWIHWGATIAVSFLAMVGLPEGFLESIRTGYGAMGASILAIIPFLVIFWFSMKTKSLLMARLTWMFYTFYYFALMISNWSQKGFWSGPYIIAVITGVIAFFFIWNLRKYLFKQQTEGAMEEIERGLAVEKLYRRAAAESNKNTASHIRKQARDLENS
ncbi:MAG: hypothetical protein KJ592_03090 [Nanoarchaeota archaeon]|nr:hypothetical protein [Nanoarchaeota archaeon]